MRYLNRVFLINSAQVKYAEINLDGNVHFIGTQGVGKSTLLRAILFFYNADTLKLGIPKSKKSFLEYYFPYSNSYIIYEVARSEGAYCVLAYKSSNKVCFRFIDGEFTRNYFINTENKAHESWGEIVQQLDTNRVYYTKRKIDSYQDYRDILYGNNSGKAKELKRYAIIESRDYQNIPRTIQNVFLNSELKAEFIKDTIIKSLGNDIQIDLSNYAHHLKDFETQLNEIKRFRDIKTMAQANSISKLHIAIKHLQAEKTKLAKELAWAVNENLEKEPGLSKRLTVEREKEEGLKAKIKRIVDLFNSRRKRKDAEITILDNSLKTAKNKEAEYAEMNIDAIIQRVSQKPTVEKENRDLSDEKTLLTSQFQELSQKYQALHKELDNQLSEFLNIKDREKLNIQEIFQEFKSVTADDFQQLIAQIRDEHRTEIANTRTELDAKKESTNKLKIEREQIKQKRFYENEIDGQQKEIKRLDENRQKAETAIERFNGQIKTLQKQWEIDEENIKKTLERDKEKIGEQIKNNLVKVEEIRTYIEASKTSLYGWLTEKYPGWENTIGKVIDEKNVLFNMDLSPQLIDKNSTSLFGVKLDLNEIDKKVKTVADYALEKQQLNEKIENLKQSLNELSKKSISNIESLKKKYRPKIKDCKDGIKEPEYFLEQCGSKKDEATIKLQDLTTLAQTEKKKAIETIETSIGKSTEEEIAAKEDVTKIEDGITKLINAKTKERDKKIAERKRQFDETISKIGGEVATKKDASQKRKKEIQAQQQNDLAHKGADTDRLTTIEQRLEKIKEELEYVEQNRDSVADYKKDKRELFDRVGEFKSEKKKIEKQLAQEETKHKKEKQALTNDLETIEATIDSLTKTLDEIKEDKGRFEESAQSDWYSTIYEHFQNVQEEYKTDIRVSRLIDNIKGIYYGKLHNRIDELRNTVTGFLGKFSDDNIFKFKKQGDDTAAFLLFAEDLSDFIEQDKIAVLEKEVNERFALIIQTIGKETTDLVSKEGEIQSVVTKINRDFVERNFAGVIKKIELKLDESRNEVVQLLKSIKAFNDENALELGATNLFSSENSDVKNQKAVDLLKQFVKKIGEMRKDEISLSDSFELKFRIEENENDTGWVEKLSNVGSDGTDVLVKAMVNIMLLNVFKEGASKRFKDFQLHCMMDEIGKLHPNNVRGILKFANDRNILLINSSPTENDALAFKHIYKLEKDKKSITKVKRIITQYSPA
jgi:DNA repair exonuclease SbcCD ATPase subunit